MKKCLLSFVLLTSVPLIAEQKPQLSLWEKISWILTNKERTLWFALASKDKNKETAIAAIKAGANVNALFFIDTTLPVKYAIHNKWPDVIELMIDYGLDLQKSPYLLHDAVIHEWYGLAKRLIDLGADINSFEKLFWFNLSPLMMAQSPKMVQFLLDHGAKIDARDPKGQNAMHSQTAKKSKENIKVLLANGADINFKDNKGFTPLHLVAQQGTPDMAEFLIAHGADINAQNNLGATPLVVAQVYGNAPVYNYLVSLRK